MGGTKGERKNNQLTQFNHQVLMFCLPHADLQFDSIFTADQDISLSGTLLLTKLLLAPMAVQVNPQFAANVILDTRVFLIVKSIQSPADHCVHLCVKLSCLLTGNVTADIIIIII